MTEFDDADAPPPRGNGQVNALRAGAVVVLFLVALLLLLGPASNGAPGAGGHTTTTTTLPSKPVHRATTRVQVANGTSTSGLAKTLSDKLTTKGWDVIEPALQATTHPTHSWVYFAPGQEHAAIAVAGDSGIPKADIVPFDATMGVQPSTNDVIVVIGPGLSV